MDHRVKPGGDEGEIVRGSPSFVIAGLDPATHFHLP